MEKRDEHIRRYAELLEGRAKIQVTQNAAPEIGYKQPPPQKKGIPRQIAEETGLSVDTVRRALNPKPAPEPKAPQNRVVSMSPLIHQDAVPFDCRLYDQIILGDQFQIDLRWK
ncbi:hypothetical protein [Croceicoccus bisphenolivorans]|uniref:hypothetical protein n=1 Tax=Croceicoccus bisphenolivorans TaxID=1783232 RepID=UPI0008330034|nr:hypothetical protein [Croceicoccus bisphenolivorans]